MDRKEIERRKKALAAIAKAHSEGKLHFPTRIINKATPEQTAMMRFTFEKIGKHITKTFEQWERYFLADPNMLKELSFWMLISFYLIDNKLEGKEAMRHAQRFNTASQIGPESELAELYRIAESPGIEKRIVDAANEGHAMLSR